MIKRVSFGPYVLDGDTRELLAGPDLSRIHVSPKALELLLLLVVERPRAMSKQELHERVWPNTFVSEATLASVASELREALGERGRSGPYLRTVHGFGYAFAADAHETGASSTAPVSHWLICDGRDKLLESDEADRATRTATRTVRPRASPLTSGRTFSRSASCSTKWRRGGGRSSAIQRQG